MDDAKCAFPPTREIPCPDSVPAGSVVRVVRLTTCSSVEQQSVRDTLDFRLKRSQGLFAVYREATAEPLPGRVPRGEFGVIVRNQDGLGDLYQVRGGRIAGIQFACGIGHAPERLIEGVAAAQILVGPSAP